MKKTKKTLKKSLYRAILAVLGKKYEATGETVSDAISALKVPVCRGKAILTIQVGEISKEKILQPAVAYRLFNSFGLTREISLKNVSLMFQGI